uniref:Putative group i salivary lipocalin n=1 Tax=Rhipicephalus pulchellus TaxID=72859 RepID=L7LQP7_RHIPC
MIKENILAAFTLAAFIIWVKCDGNSAFPDFPEKAPDITKFYSTNATILIMRTTKRRITCKVDKVANATNTSVFFDRSYCIGQQWVNKTLEGTFTAVSVFVNGTFDAMIVHPPGIMGKRIEQLLYADPGYNCGVFKVFLQSTSGNGRIRAIYELRIRHSYDRPYDSKCLVIFRKYAENNYVDAYLPTCNSNNVICK